MYQVLLDSEAAINFIHEEIVQRPGLKTSATPEPLQILRVNEKILLIVICQVTLRYTIAKVPYEDTFMIASIGTHSLILSMQFLKWTDALVKWKEWIVHFSSQSVVTSEPSEALICSSQVISLRLVHLSKQKKRKLHCSK